MDKLFKNNCNIVLASASPRRQQFLLELGINFDIIKPSCIEPSPHNLETPSTYAMRVANTKGKHVLELLNNSKAYDNKALVIIAADTIVCIDGQILGKPNNNTHALQMLKMLAGKTHEVITGVNIIIKANSVDEISFFESSAVTFHAWSENVLINYANSQEPLDKAGSYAIQGQGSFLVSSINGSWSNVVGLPITSIVDILIKNSIISA